MRQNWVTSKNTFFRSLSAWFLTKERRQKPKNYMVKYFKLLSHFIHKLRKIRFTNTAKWQKWHFLLILSIFYRSLRFFKSKRRATYDYLYDPLTWCKKLEKSNAEISRYVQKTPFLGKKRRFLPKMAPLWFFYKNPKMSLSSHYWCLTSCQKSKKSNEPIQRKTRTYGRTDGRTEPNS